MTQETYEAVLFDMDGVVVDTERTVAAFWQALAADHGFVISDDDLDEHVFGRHAEHTLRALFPAVADTGHPQIYERLRINDQTLRYAEIPGATRLIGELRAAGVPVALVTGAQEWKAVAVLDQLGLTDSFDVQIRADDIPVGKPDPACYRLAAEKLGVDIGRCLVFEDAFSGVTAAVSAGATCVAIGPRRREARLVATGALTVVSSFHQTRYEPEHDRLRVDQHATLPFTPVGARAR
ncbi:HAD family phosphatase [Micromonospora sp. WMMD882]|uniref:HAD family hydrolase n=1 Tax=Micromonospora sp. WMMD882 TaxID=3015151 RepID=UPI00248BCFC8|nr:HAD family phosphatase [Micromonospora sp. WMMD882]WBB78673.1 HAD family phosphatase [Micromonospora sp. WMMD882]